jgi:hypothetical protein
MIRTGRDVIVEVVTLPQAGSDSVLQAGSNHGGNRPVAVRATDNTRLRNKSPHLPRLSSPRLLPYVRKVACVVARDSWRSSSMSVGSGTPLR